MSAKSVGGATFHRSDSDATLSHHHPELGSQRRNGSNGSKKWLAVAHCWWWEISGALLSAICMGLILIILAKADGIALDAWRLPIQPNSLISVFTTVGKSALMVPLAGCLSQLAWQHFASEPKSLDHMRVFDDASRGPWGAMELILVIGKKGYLARFLAVTTVLALGIEPFAQQVLEFGNRDVEVAMPMVQIAAASTYQSRAFRNGDLWRDNPEKLSRNVIRDNDISNAILGVKTQPYFYCPPSANNCTFPEFTTLGVCGAVTNRAEGEPKCEKGVTNDKTCTFTWAGNNSMSLTFNKQTDPANPKGDRQHEVFRLRVEHPSNTAKAATGLTMTAIRANSSEVLDSIRTNRYPKVELLTLRLYWCTQTYPWTNASSAHLVPSEPITEPLTLAPGTENNRSEWLTFTSASANEYHIHRETHNSVWDYLGTKILTSHVLMNTNPTTPPSSSPSQDYSIGTEQGTCHSTLEMFLYASNLHNVTQNLATLLSNYIRSRTSATPADPYNAFAVNSPADDNILPGDNNNATVLAGSAWKDETYIEVRWGWISVPLGETLLTVMLLVATIVSARLSGVPVLGSPPLGLLFHGLERRGEGGERVDSRGAMVGVARGMEVQLGGVRGGDGRGEGEGRMGFRVVEKEDVERAGMGSERERERGMEGEERGGGGFVQEMGYELQERGGKGDKGVGVTVTEKEIGGDYDRA